MSNLELKIVLDVLGINYAIEETIIGIKGTQYKWKGCTLYSSGSYYNVIEGRIPYTVAKILSKKYPNHRDDVRIEGTYGYGKVRSKYYYSEDEAGNTYISCYHIDSKEGLIYLLSELQFYYEKCIYTEKLRKALYRKQRAAIIEVYKRLIEQGNPYKTTEEWLKAHGKTGDINNEAALEILPYIKVFDETVNPFCNSNYVMKAPEEYVSKVEFDLYAKSTYLWMEIFNKNVKIEYSRVKDFRNNDEYISYSLSHYIDSNKMMYVSHCISDNKNENVICLRRFDKHYSGNCRLELKFDLFSGMAYVNDNYKGKSPITPEQKELIIKELKKAIDQAEKVIINKMATKKA
ncbi:MAG: hypothetical protein N2749_07340 [Clostridia bacterium]|nr:hypothetical protein [Clostridia bacterium]